MMVVFALNACATFIPRFNVGFENSLLPIAINIFINKPYSNHLISGQKIFTYIINKTIDTSPTLNPILIKSFALTMPLE